MSRYLDPKADIVFKRIFGEHPELLKSFLNAVLPLNDDQKIVSLEYLMPEQAPVIPAFKRTIVDVKCRDKHGRIFIVEMQVNWTDSFKQRLLFGTSQAIVKQLQKGEKYHLLQPVYGLGIIAQTYDHENPEWYHHYQLVEQNQNQHRRVIEHLQLIFIELPKFQIQSHEEKKLRLLWLRFLREIDENTKKVSQDLLDVPEISKAVDLSEQAAYSPVELEAYETYWDSVRIESTLIFDSYQKGQEEGRAQGREEGVAQGREEEKLIIAKNLLYRKIDLETVSAITGLDLAIVLQIHASLE